MTIGALLAMATISFWEDAIPWNAARKQAAAAEANARQFQQQQNVASLEKNIQAMQSDNAYLKDRLQKAEVARSDAEEDRDRVKKNVDTNQQALQKQVAYLQKYKSRLHQAIQDFSRQRVLEQFGPGPHRVEVLVEFHPESNVVTPSDARIVLELAPLDDMPHANYWFLSQVVHGTYNGCSFHRNAGHVIQGGPSPNHLSQGKSWKDLNQQFKSVGLESILFQEYSPNFPHVAYTVGYAGRPGGPDFYISMQDNSRVHGPGGQRSYEDPSEADVCFAKVVQGRDVADLIHQSAVQPGGYKHMVHNVAIVHMKWLPSENVTTTVAAAIAAGGEVQ
jgi:cyclophilin family peptidyl-prolyl cis-trans isomerase